MQILNSLALFKTAIIKTLAKEVILKKKKEKKIHCIFKDLSEKRANKKCLANGNQKPIYSRKGGKTKCKSAKQIYLIKCSTELII